MKNKGANGKSCGGSDTPWPSEQSGTTAMGTLDTDAIIMMCTTLQDTSISSTASLQNLLENQHSTSPEQEKSSRKEAWSSGQGASLGFKRLGLNSLYHHTLSVMP